MGIGDVVLFPLKFLEDGEGGWMTSTDHIQPQLQEAERHDWRQNGQEDFCSEGCLLSLHRSFLP